MSNWSSSSNQDPDVWGPSDVDPPRSAAPQSPPPRSYAPPQANSSSAAGSSSPASVVVGCLVAAACAASAYYLYQQNSKPRPNAFPPRFHGPSESQVFTGSPPHSDNLPSGPSGVFPTLAPPAVSADLPASQTGTFQLGDPQDRRALEQYLEGELNRIVPEASQPVFTKT